MNERIKLLAEQARVFAVQTVDVECKGSLDEALDAAFEEKFAELIVQECARIAEENDLGIDIVSTRIKEHFGVEE
jgi:hypothetical protein